VGGPDGTTEKHRGGWFSRSPSNQRSVAEHYRRLTERKSLMNMIMERRGHLVMTALLVAANRHGRHRADTGASGWKNPLGAQLHQRFHWTFVTRAPSTSRCAKNHPLRRTQTILVFRNKNIIGQSMCSSKFPRSVGSGRSSWCTEAAIRALVCHQRHRQPKAGIPRLFVTISLLYRRSGRTRAAPTSTIRILEEARATNNASLIQRLCA